MELAVEIITDTHGVIHAKCVSCRESTPLEVTPAELNRFLETEVSIQDCFPNMARDYREMLISGFCPKCWTNLFKPKVRPHGQ